MSNITSLPVAQSLDPAEIMERVLLAGDLSKLSHDEKTRYLMQTCSSLGLNPLTKPFDYIRLSGREVLYATKGCADQLRSNRRISLEVTDRKVVGDLMTVTVRATAPDGRFDEDMAAVSVKGLAGEALANAAMKAITKAKRRVTLSICGLGMLDETEVRSAIEAEALAGSATKAHGLSASVSESPRPKAIAKSETVADLPKPAKPPIRIKLHDGTAAEFARTGAGLDELYKFLSDGILDGHPEVVGLNCELLDAVVRAYPGMADDVAELRAAAAMAMMPPDEPEPDPDPDDLDEFGLPPLRQDPEVLPTDPP